jgi:acyl carrier protein
MSNTEIIAKVNALMHQGFEIPMEKLTPSATLFEELGLDSLDAIDMLVHLEENLKIKVDAEKLTTVRTLQDIYNLVEGLAVQSNPQSQLSH